MNSSSPRVVLVGCGGIARAHLAATRAGQVVALCDSHPAAAERLRAQYELDVPLFTSLETALKTQSPNIAIICTPPATHFPLGCLALNAGVNLLCEKPLALSAHESYTLIEAALEHGLTLRTSAKYRFCEGVIAAKSLLASGETGGLQSVSIAFGAPFDFTRSWHANTALSGGGVWMDNGPHALDLARHFAGELHFESIEDWQTEADLETEGHVNLRSTSGIPIQITLSWARSLGDHFALLHCERGTLEIGWQETLWHPHESPSRKLANAYNKAHCFAAQWQAFLNNDPLMQLEDGARTIELIEAIYRTAKAKNHHFHPVIEQKSEELGAKLGMQESRHPELAKDL